MIVFYNDCNYIGGCKDFLEWALQKYKYVDSTPIENYKL